MAVPFTIVQLKLTVFQSHLWPILGTKPALTALQRTVESRAGQLYFRWDGVRGTPPPHSRILSAMSRNNRRNPLYPHGHGPSESNQGLSSFAMIFAVTSTVDYF